MEKAAFNDNTSIYVGTKLSSQPNKAQIAGKALTSTELEKDTYYIFDEDALKSIELGGIELNKNQVYIVNYENGDVIFPYGLKETSGEIVYKLSEMLDT